MLDFIGTRSAHAKSQVDVHPSMNDTRNDYQFPRPTNSHSGPGVLAGSFTGVAIPALGADITPATATGNILVLARDARLGFARGGE